MYEIELLQSQPHPQALVWEKRKENETSGVAKAGPDWAHAQPKHHVRPSHVTQSRVQIE